MGALNTDMLQTYGHLVDKDIDREIAKLYGVVTPETETSDALEPRQCPRCFSVWGPTLQHCGVWGTPLSPQAMADMDEALSELQGIILEDPVREIEAIRLIREKGHPNHRRRECPGKPNLGTFTGQEALYRLVDKRIRALVGMCGEC